MVITIIGSGNVAHHLGLGLFKAGHRILQVYSRNLNPAKELAKRLKARATDNLHTLQTTADLYLICVSDKAIEEVALQIDFEPELIAHTSGSISLSALSRFKNHGVFYPLQTFSKAREVPLNNVPFCIEANTPENKTRLSMLAGTLSGKIYELDSEQRKQCHLAAVFANNFVNHLYVLAQQLLKEKNIPFDILKPLILETAQKVQQLAPGEAQTGPALRNDIQVIEAHIEQLKSDKLEKLYRFVTASITEVSKSKPSEGSQIK